MSRLIGNCCMILLITYEFWYNRHMSHMNSYESFSHLNKGSTGGLHLSSLSDPKLRIENASVQSQPQHLLLLVFQSRLRKNKTKASQFNLRRVSKYIVLLILNQYTVHFVGYLKHFKITDVYTSSYQDYWNSEYNAECVRCLPERYTHVLGPKLESIDQQYVISHV